MYKRSLCLTIFITKSLEIECLLKHKNKILILEADFFNKVEKKGSKVILNGKNNKMIINCKTFKQLEYLKYKISSYIMYLRNVIELINFIINSFIYNDLKYCIELDKVCENLVVRNELSKNLELFKKIAREKTLYYIPYDYI